MTLWSDLDGVVFDFSNGLFKYTNTKPFYYEDYYDDRLMKLFNQVKRDPEFWMSLELYEGIKPELFKNVKCFLTHRPDEAAEATLKRLRELGFKQNVIIDNSKSKIHYLDKSNVTHYIEDNWENWALCNTWGIRCFLIKKDWNKKFHNHHLAFDKTEQALNQFKKDMQFVYEEEEAKKAYNIEMMRLHNIGM